MGRRTRVKNLNIKSTGKPIIQIGHPLAQDLVFYTLFENAGGIPTDLVTGKVGTVVGTRFPMSYGIEGKTMAWAGGGSLAYDRDSRMTERKVFGLSFACCVRRGGTLGSNARPFAKTYSNGGSTPFLNYGFDYNSGGAGQNRVRAYIGTTGGLQSTTSVDAPDTTRPRTIVGVRFGNGDLHCYVDGKLLATNTANTSPIQYDAPTTSKIIISGSSAAAAANTWIGDIYWCAIWMRILSRNEIFQLWKQPYAFIGGKKRYYNRIVSVAPPAATTGIMTPRSTWWGDL